MSSDRWLTYAEAADLLGITAGSLRNRAAREGWAKDIDAQGRAVVQLPADAAAYAPDDAGGKARRGRPREARPASDRALAAAQVDGLKRRVAELEAELVLARSERDQERADRQRERERADRAASETAEVALCLAGTVDESRAMAKADRARAAAAQAELAAATEAYRKEVGHLRSMLARMLHVHDYVQMPLWKQAITPKPPKATGFDTMAFQAEQQTAL